MNLWEKTTEICNLEHQIHTTGKTTACFRASASNMHFRKTQHLHSYIFVSLQLEQLTVLDSPHTHNYTSCTTAAVEKLRNFLQYQKLLIHHNNKWWCQNSSTNFSIFSGNISVPRFTTNCPHQKKKKILHWTGKTKLKPWGDCNYGYSTAMRAITLHSFILQ